MFSYVLSSSSCSYPVVFLAPDHQLGDRLGLSGTLRAGCGNRHSWLQAGHRRLPPPKPTLSWMTSVYPTEFYPSVHQFGVNLKCIPDPPI